MEKYEYIKAIVDYVGLRWEYRLEGSSIIGRLIHDEDVSGFTEDEIIDLTCSMLDAEDQRDIITVEYR